MSFIHTALAFLFALCTLIVFHELGHYWVARLCNVKVLRFSLGMGKVLFSRRFGPDQTEWVISALPLGGYVKMLDSREQELGEIAPADLAREFTRQSVWKRIAIVAAGPLANFILAIFLFSILYMVGMPEPIAKLRHPAPSTQAYQAGIRGDELVTAVNSKPIQFWSELRWELLQQAVDKQAATLTLVSDGSTRQVTLSLDGLSPQDLETDFLSALGLSLALSKAQLGQVVPDGPAMRAGLQKDDIVTEIDGKVIFDSLDLIETVRASPNKLLQLKVSRSGAILEFTATPEAVTVNGQLIGKLNVEVRSTPEVLDHQESLFAAIQKASQRTWSTSVLTLKMIGKMVLGEVSLKNITGPLTIADYAGQTAKIGWISYVNFLAFISISLGVMNLLPIPVLDGGHLLYYSLEVLTGRPVSTRFWEMAQRAGLAILMILMFVAFFNDIVRLLPT
ncbi:RIP metalloprotease RseP [Solimicrobium silvestre]|uniref:Zinc metalloprotease n=1 Tax=Solimicrobium silvestre TaxID=2099400 RepID=A0A2S9GWQ3_9BURK|nr:RIP metalloprotease RseP [Solimicrobium silvestre]PRC92153.1 RIP metalloprotease RseP [Solimicrobium silvestre]